MQFTMDRSQIVKSKKLKIRFKKKKYVDSAIFTVEVTASATSTTEKEESKKTIESILNEAPTFVAALPIITITTGAQFGYLYNLPRIHDGNGDIVSLKSAKYGLLKNYVKILARSEAQSFLDGAEAKVLEADDDSSF